MAYRRKYYKRRYRRYRRYKQVSQNYFRVKAEFYDRIYYPDPNNPDAQAGHAIWHSRRSEAEAMDRYLLRNLDILSGYTYSVTLAGIFSYYRLTGIRIEITPDARNQSLPAASVEVPLYISFRAGDNAAQSINQIKANNNSILCNPIQKQVKYIRTLGGTSAYLSSDIAYSGAWTVLGENQLQYALAPSYKVKIVYYFLYKQSKV